MASDARTTVLTGSNFSIVRFVCIKNFTFNFLVFWKKTDKKIQDIKRTVFGVCKTNDKEIWPNKKGFAPEIQKQQQKQLGLRLADSVQRSPVNGVVAALVFIHLHYFQDWWSWADIYYIGKEEEKEEEEEEEEEEDHAISYRSFYEYYMMM